jgi:hypothetical protein
MKPNKLTVARPLAPEEIDAGMYVAVLHEHESIMPFFHAESMSDFKNIEPIRWRDTPERARPFRVVSVCVPFVLVERPSGKHSTLDIRVPSLAMLSESFGAESFKRLRPNRKRRNARSEGSDDVVRQRRSWKRLWRRDRG